MRILVTLILIFKQCMEGLMQRPEVQEEAWKSEVEIRGSTALLTFHRDKEPRPYQHRDSYQYWDPSSDHDPPAFPVVEEASDSE